MGLRAAVSGSIVMAMALAAMLLCHAALERIAPAPRVLVVAFGDSTQAGISDATSEVVAPATIAQQVLREQLQRTDFSVASAGMGGTRSIDLLAGRDGSGLAWPDRVWYSGAQVITINHLINDALIKGGSSDEQYRANLTDLVTTAQRMRRHVVLETPNPLVPNTPTSVHFDLASFERKVQIMREVAAATGATLCDEKAEIERQGMATLRWLPDGVHPHKALYQAKGIMLAECLRPLMR